MTSASGNPGSRPKRSRAPAAKIIDPDNTAEPALSTHGNAAKGRCSQHASERHTLGSDHAPDTSSMLGDPAGDFSESAPHLLSTSPPQSTQDLSSNYGDVEEIEDNESAMSMGQTKKRSALLILSSDSERSGTMGTGGRKALILKELDRPQAAQRPKKKKKLAATINVDEMDSDGFLVDVQIQNLDKSTLPGSHRDKVRDVNTFFSKPIKSDSGKSYRTCLKCKKTIVSEVTTNRRHLEVYHAPAYRQWLHSNPDFESKLPTDVKKRKQALKTEKQRQQELDEHLQEMPKKERVIAYSEGVFRRAACEWLIATDQPLSALEHPAYRNMINIASRARDGVMIPSRKVARREIMAMFNEYMLKLKADLSSSAVTGDINATTDAWQAETTDAYQAVTLHYIKEVTAGQWELKNALGGFVRLNNSHNGKRLGQALFKVVDRLGIAGRIGHVTCDNASNNGTMLQAFAKLVKARTGRPFDPVKSRINCVAHVINLATQYHKNALPKRLSTKLTSNTHWQGFTWTTKGVAKLEDEVKR